VVRIQAFQRGIGMGATFVEPLLTDIGTSRRKKKIDDFCAIKEQTNHKPTHGVNAVELELCPSETELLEVALTRAQRDKAGQLLTDAVVIEEREPRHAKTK
jgi:hypothetical protein